MVAPIGSCGRHCRTAPQGNVMVDSISNRSGPNTMLDARVTSSCHDRDSTMVNPGDTSRTAPLFHNREGVMVDTANF